MDYIVAREGKGQRVVPTDMAAGDNEIGRRRDFSDTHFLGGGGYLRMRSEMDCSMIEHWQKRGEEGLFQCMLLGWGDESLK